jgi:hypothetical protein
MLVRKDNYLNIVLTVIALLLAGLLWTQVAEESFVDTAKAQIRSGSARTVAAANEPAVDEGVSSIGQRAWNQRQELIVELAVMGRMIGELSEYIRSGKMEVRVGEAEDRDTDRRTHRKAGEH